jgi:hypothetical protein
MSFREQTSSFFDELSAMLDEQQKGREDELDIRTDRPYSSLLTRDEEPASDYSPQQADESEPEVWTRAQA